MNKENLEEIYNNAIKTLSEKMDNDSLESEDIPSEFKKILKTEISERNITQEEVINSILEQIKLYKINEVHT